MYNKPIKPAWHNNGYICYMILMTIFSLYVERGYESVQQHGTILYVVH